MSVIVLSRVFISAKLNQHTTEKKKRLKARGVIINVQKAKNKHIVLFRLQKFPVLKLTSHFLLSVMIQIQDNGFLTTFTLGSVILATPEPMFSLATQESEKVLWQEP